MTTSRTKETCTVRTMCPMNCHPTLCGMLATVEGDHLIAIKGDRENPDSRGFLCVRGQAAGEIIDNPRRLLYPMVRETRGSADWRRVSWDEALDRIVAGFRAVGREAVGLWPGHGALTNDFGTFVHAELALRFGNMYGCQWWDPCMICWGLGGFGLGLTGNLEANTKEDMGKHSDLIILWGANIASQPNTGRHITAAKRRGARVVVIDVRVTEACRLADDYFIIRPGTDAALALAMMHVIITESRHDKEFIDRHTIGFTQLTGHIQQLTPEWADAITGIGADLIREFARDYAATERAMILLGGSSMYKDRHGWQASRAISCLPPLTGKSGKPGAGLGPRHAAQSHGFATQHILNFEARPPGNYVPNQMSTILDAIVAGRVRAFLMLGTNMLSSYADAQRMEQGLAQMEMIVCHDLFMNDMARRYADIMLPATAWLEDTGVKGTHTHLYLMDQALPPAGEARSMTALLRDLAERLEIDDFYPWGYDNGHIDAVLDHPCTGHATVASLREQGGIGELNISHVAHIDHRYATPSGKIEFYSERAAEHGLPALPDYLVRPASDFPLELRNGRMLTHFHAFYDHGRALPSIERLEQGPTLWISVEDAAARGLTDGLPIRIHNERGECDALARVTDDVPPGTVYMHDGWPGFNNLSSSENCIPDSAVNLFPFSTGQAAYDARVEVTAK